MLLLFFYFLRPRVLRNALISGGIPSAIGENQRLEILYVPTHELNAKIKV